MLIFFFPRCLGPLLSAGLGPVQVGRISGSWLGPLLCDGEVKGPNSREVPNKKPLKDGKIPGISGKNGQFLIKLEVWSDVTAQKWFSFGAQTYELPQKSAPGTVERACNVMEKIAGRCPVSAVQILVCYISCLKLLFGNVWNDSLRVGIFHVPFHGKNVDCPWTFGSENGRCGVWSGRCPSGRWSQHLKKSLTSSGGEQAAHCDIFLWKKHQWIFHASWSSWALFTQKHGPPECVILAALRTGRLYNRGQRESFSPYDMRYDMIWQQIYDIPNWIGLKGFIPPLSTWL